MRFGNRKTIVLMLHQGMGDLLMAVPLLKAIVLQAEAGMTVVVAVKTPREATIVGLAAHNHPRLRVEPIGSQGLRRILNLIRFIWRHWRPAVFIVPITPDRLRNALWIFAIHPTVGIGPKGAVLDLVLHKTIRPPSLTHKTEYMLELSQAAGFASPQSVDISIAVSDSAARSAAKLLPRGAPGHRWVALCPGSGPAERHKRWPAEYYGRLVGMLRRHSEDIYFAVVGSIEETGLIDSVIRSADSPASHCKVICGQPIDVAAGVLARCGCVVSGCAGLSHLAAAVGAPIVGLFGPTNPGVTGPYTKKCIIIRTDMDCSPCYRAGFTAGCADPQCMRRIEPERVLNAVLKVLERSPLLRD